MIDLFSKEDRGKGIRIIYRSNYFIQIIDSYQSQILICKIILDTNKHLFLIAVYNCKNKKNDLKKLINMID